MPAHPYRYDRIGSAYTGNRRTEPRVAARIWAALGDARTVVNVGAGTGSYEPLDRDVTAIEPSAAEERAVSAIRADLDSGRWSARNHAITGLEIADLGARILVA
jgi:hypothetical protein